MFLLSTVLCDKVPNGHDDIDGVNFVTQNGMMGSNTPLPFSNSGGKSFESNQDDSKPTGLAFTSDLMVKTRVQSQQSTILRDNTDDSSTEAFPSTQNVAKVDDRITTKYDIGLEKQHENLDNSDSQTTPFPFTSAILVEVCDTDQVEVTGNSVQVNAFTNGTSCNLLVTAPNTSIAISVKLLKSGLNATYFYIERLGNSSSNCSDRYILVSVDYFPCLLVIGGNKFKFHFLNTEIMFEIASLKIQMLSCLDTESPVLESEQCNSTSYITKMEQKVEYFRFDYYHNKIRKTLNVNTSIYLSKCICASCKHTLGYSEWLSTCIDGKYNNTRTRIALIVYQPDMKGLSFAYTGLHAIQPNAFFRLEYLEVLILEHNSLSTLPPTICQNLPQLKVMKCGYNVLMNLTSDLFKGQCEQHLLRIDLNNNRLTYVATDLFNSTSMLRHLYLSQNRLVHIFTGTFKRLTLLEEIDLSGNHMSNLTKGVFDSLGGLGYIYLSDNRIESLPAGVFDSLGELEILDLSGNQIVSLAAGVFDLLGELWTLYLSDNRISSLPTGVFDSLGRLWKLDLSDNYIASLPAGVFDSLGGLWYLDLSDNYITSVIAGAFDSLA